MVPEFFVDGRGIEFREGDMIMEACDRAGIAIPRLCHHPFLPGGGNCRICLVKIEGRRKLEPSCLTPAAEGMKVETDAREVVDFRKGLLELLLINHPLDCPLCDKAGECLLQDHYMKYGLFRGRYDLHKRRMNRKAELGSLLWLNQERCIRCARCTRFVAKVTGEEGLHFFMRGGGTFVSTVSGFSRDFLYQGCLDDLCPVGAIIMKDFRFKCPVWLMERTGTFCTLCSTLCPIEVHHHGGRVMRIKPGCAGPPGFICDTGRMAYLEMYRESRLLTPLVNGIETSPERALRSLRESIASAMRAGHRVGAILTPLMTLEEMFLLARFARGAAGESAAPLLGIKDPPSPFPSPRTHDDFLISRERMPNLSGFEKVCSGFGAGVVDGNELLGLIGRGEISGLLSPSFNLLEYIPQEERSTIANLSLLYCGSTRPAPVKGITYLLPLPFPWEYSGTFIRGDGRVIETQRAVSPARGILPVRDVISGIARELLPETLFTDVEEEMESILNEGTITRRDG